MSLLGTEDGFYRKSSRVQGEVLVSIEIVCGVTKRCQVVPGFADAVVRFLGLGVLFTSGLGNQ